MAEWSIATDCKSVDASLRRFKSYSAQTFDFAMAAAMTQISRKISLAITCKMIIVVNV